MARCPFAVWMPLPWTGGHFIPAPYKIVHHVTEGYTAQSAFDTYKDPNRKHSIPHFTIDETHIYQHLDTDIAARALRHHGSIETNRSSAIQYELVGFSGRDKDPLALKNAGRLCRWIESVYSIPKNWPNGYPNPPKNGDNPGHHNRSVTNWTTTAGHYGHCHVPENDHWDPAFTAEEVEVVMSVAEADFAAEVASSHMFADASMSAVGNLLANAQTGSSSTDANIVSMSDAFGKALEDIQKLGSSDQTKFGGFFPAGVNYFEFSIAQTTGVRIVVSSQPSTKPPQGSSAEAVDHVAKVFSPNLQTIVDGFSVAHHFTAAAPYPEWALKRDLQTAEAHYWNSISLACGASHLDRSIVLAIGSKESQWGLALKPEGAAGTGDWTPRDPAKWGGHSMPPDGKGWGRGLMQIDWFSHEFAKTGEWYDADKNVQYGCKLLRDNIDRFVNQGMDKSTAIRCGVSAYNGQHGPHSPYCDDVMTRADWFAKHPYH